MPSPSLVLSSSSSRIARLRIVSINDVYELTNLPHLDTFLKSLSPKPSAVVLAGDFLSPSVLSSIDGGRGMVSTLRAIGMTHVSIGNHEQDLRLDALHERLAELADGADSETTTATTTTRGVIVLNTNMQTGLPPKAEWMRSVTQPYSILASHCGNVKVALLGLLSDEPGVFRDNTFKSVPIQNILDAYTGMHQRLVRRDVDLIVPVTHASVVRDKELANHMLSLHGGSGVIIGGHEHDPYHEIVTAKGPEPEQGQALGNHPDHSSISDNDTGDAVHVLKSGMDARNACLIDLVFELPNERCQNEQDTPKTVDPTAFDDTPLEEIPSRLVEIASTLVDLSMYEPSPQVKQLVDKHMSVVQALENEIIIEADSVLSSLPADRVVSSQRSRFQQTTIGSIFCQMIKEELEDCNVAMINGAVLKGDRIYQTAKLSYAELKNELPFPTKIVVVEMTRTEVREAIFYSRTAPETGTDPLDGEVPRRGYLQVDYDFDREMTDDGKNEAGDEILTVALPRNLLNGFCKIKPLMEVGERLKEQERFPGEDDFVPAIDLIVRYASKNRWQHLIKDEQDFSRFDLNNDGVLDKQEIKIMMKEILGYEPADFVVDDMVGAIDTDENGVIDHDEFRRLLAQMERDNKDLRKE